MPVNEIGAGNGLVSLIAVDSKEDMCVSCCDKEFDVSLGVGGVCEVGFDNRFILLKKYKELKDSLGDSIFRYDKSSFEYDIIPVDSARSITEG